jgi:hypothetical protein
VTTLWYVCKLDLLNECLSAESCSSCCIRTPYAIFVTVSVPHHTFDDDGAKDIPCGRSGHLKCYTPLLLDDLVPPTGALYDSIPRSDATEMNLRVSTFVNAARYIT